MWPKDGSALARQMEGRMCHGPTKKKMTNLEHGSDILGAVATPRGRRRGAHLGCAHGTTCSRGPGRRQERHRSLAEHRRTRTAISDVVTATMICGRSGWGQGGRALTVAMAIFVACAPVRPCVSHLLAPARLMPATCANALLTTSHIFSNFPYFHLKNLTLSTEYW